MYQKIKVNKKKDEGSSIGVNYIIQRTKYNSKTYKMDKLGHRDIQQYLNHAKFFITCGGNSVNSQY
jgi:hypothetical protein